MHVMENEIELKPCPFCGSNDLEDLENEDYYKIKCRVCWAMCGYKRGLKAAILNWNKRAADLPKTALSEKYFGDFD